MEQIERNKELIKQLQTCADRLWENKGIGNKELISCIKSVNVVLKEFVGRISEFESMGVSIPQEIILTQLRNLMDGFEKKDTSLLADTLEYEIKNTLLFYNDILAEIEKETEEC